MIKRQLRTICICAAVCAILALGYFFALKPILNKEGETTEEEIELLDGETLQNGRILITPKVERDNLKNVYIKNKVDEYKLVHHLGYDIYYIEGAELVQINYEALSNVVVNTGYLLSMMRVAAKDIEDGNEILANLEQFGFNPDNSYFIMTKTDDSWYKIIIGDKIPTSGGYYVMYEDENGLRPAIYIIDTMLEENILSSRYALMMAYISEPIDQSEYFYINNFKLYKGKELFVEMYQGDIPPDSDVLVNHQMRFPAAYTPDTNNYDAVLRTFIGFVGDAVVATDIDEDVLREYGFDNYGYKITFEFGEKEYEYYFTELTENNSYYVLSEAFGAIIEIGADKVPFLTWDLLKFIDKPIFSQHIDTVESISVTTHDGTDTFILEGTGRPDSKTGKGGLKVTGNGKSLDADTFRKFYMSILSIDWWDYEDMPENADPMCEMVITMRNGEVIEYKFYFVPTSTRRCYFTINGRGDFYVLREKVLKLISDTKLALQDILVDADAPE